MTWTAFLLVMLSAFTHAGWNLLSKHEKPSVSFYLRANLTGILCLSPILLVFRHYLPFFPDRVWISVILAGFFQAIYFSSLGKGYQNGEMTVIYPLARTAPVLTIGILSIFLGQSMLTPYFFTGALFIVIGGALLPLRNTADILHYRRHTTLLLFAAGAAVGTTGYSLVDSQAVKILASVFHNNTINFTWQSTLLYWIFECISTCIWLSVFLLLSGGFKSPAGEKQKTASQFLVGFQIVFTYFLVLLAMNYVSNVSYIAALRQASIPIGMVLGILLLKETSSWPKITGSLLIISGLLFISLPA